MSDSPNQPESWNAAGRTAALLLAIVVFAAIWEADSDRNRPRHVASEIGSPPALSPSDSARPIEIGSRESTGIPQGNTTVQLNRVLNRNSGMVRVQLQLQPVAHADSERRAQLSERVCEGKVDEVKSELVALLKELEETSDIVPASATTTEKPPTRHRGYIFLSRRAEPVTTQQPVSVGSPDSTFHETSKPALLDSSIRIGIR
jgi:hypothetical protein